MSEVSQAQNEDPEARQAEVEFIQSRRQVAEFGKGMYFTGACLSIVAAGNVRTMNNQTFDALNEAQVRLHESGYNTSVGMLVGSVTLLLMGFGVDKAASSIVRRVNERRQQKGLEPL